MQEKDDNIAYVSFSFKKKKLNSELHERRKIMTRKFT